MSKSRTAGLVVGAVAIGIIGAAGGAWLTERRGAAGIANNTPGPVSSDPAPVAQSLPPEQEAQISVPPDTLARIRLEYAKVFSRAAGGEIRVPGTIQPNAYRQTRVTPL